TGAATLRFLAVEDRLEAARAVTEVGRAAHRAWVERTFGHLVRGGAARERKIMELVAVVDGYTWHVLRRVLDVSQTQRAMCDLANGVLENHETVRRTAK